MFFIIGITGGRKDLRFNQMVICSRCGRYGRYEVYMTYTALSLFFIPCFKWNKEYFVRMSCCGTVVPLRSGSGEAYSQRRGSGDTAGRSSTGPGRTVRPVRTEWLGQPGEALPELRLHGAGRLCVLPEMRAQILDGALFCRKYTFTGSRQMCYNNAYFGKVGEGI